MKTSFLAIAGTLVLCIAKAVVGAAVPLPCVFANAVYGFLSVAARSVVLRAHLASVPPGAPMRRVLLAAAALVIIASLSYIACGIGMLAGEWSMKVSYGEIAGISVATIAFVELGFAIAGLLSSRARRMPAFSAMKSINLASAFVAISLAQAALMSFSHEGATQVPDALGCITMGVASLAVGAIMTLRCPKGKR